MKFCSSLKVENIPKIKYLKSQKKKKCISIKLSQRVLKLQATHKISVH